jgi:cbb3-type cytochrome oxidase subunit 3
VSFRIVLPNELYYILSIVGLGIFILFISLIFLCILGIFYRRISKKRFQRYADHLKLLNEKLTKVEEDIDDDSKEIKGIELVTTTLSFILFVLTLIIINLRL